MLRLVLLLGVCLVFVAGCGPEKKEEGAAPGGERTGESRPAAVEKKPSAAAPADAVSRSEFDALEARVTALEAKVAAGAGIVSGAGAGTAVPGIGVPNKRRDVWTITKVAKGPTIDGTLSDAAWKKASQVQLVSNKGERLANDTVVALCHDGEKLYMGAIALESEMDKIKVTCTKRDDKVWKDDCYEIYFDHDSDGEDAVKVCVNPNGVFMDFIRQSGGDGDDVTWGIDVKTQKLKDRWIVEMSFPLKDMKLEYKPGLGFKFNLMRMRSGNGRRSEYSTWWGKINRIDSLGKVAFE